MPHMLMTINWDNWRHKIELECPARIQSYYRRKNVATEQQRPWPFCHCSRRPSVPMDKLRQMFGPVDKNNIGHTYAECSYYYCPEIHPTISEQIDRD